MLFYGGILLLLMWVPTYPTNSKRAKSRWWLKPDTYLILSDEISEYFSSVSHSSQPKASRQKTRNFSCGQRKIATAHAQSLRAGRVKVIAQNGQELTVKSEVIEPAVTLANFTEDWTYWYTSEKLTSDGECKIEHRHVNRCFSVMAFYYCWYKSNPAQPIRKEGKLDDVLSLVHTLYSVTKWVSLYYL